MEDVLYCGYCEHTSDTHELKECKECGWRYCVDCGNDEICGDCHDENELFWGEDDCGCGECEECNRDTIDANSIDW